MLGKHARDEEAKGRRYETREYKFSNASGVAHIIGPGWPRSSPADGWDLPCAKGDWIATALIGQSDRVSFLRLEHADFAKTPDCKVGIAEMALHTDGGQIAMYDAAIFPADSADEKTLDAFFEDAEGDAVIAGGKGFTFVSPDGFASGKTYVDPKGIMFACHIRNAGMEFAPPTALCESVSESLLDSLNHLTEDELNLMCHAHEEGIAGSVFAGPEGGAGAGGGDAALFEEEYGAAVRTICSAARRLQNGEPPFKRRKI